MSDGQVAARPRTAVEVWIRRHDNVPDCDVVLTSNSQQMVLACKSYEQAVKWARMECRSYKVTAAINQP